MSFISTNTENPLGQRPLNLMARQQGMGSMGDTIVGPTPAQAAGTVDATNQTNWYSALSYLQAWNANLKQVESFLAQQVNAAMQAGQDTSVWQSLAADTLSSRQKFNSLAGQYTTIYRAVYGSVPSGLSGGMGYMGVFDPLTAAVYATILSTILIAAVAGYEYSLALQERAQAQLQQQQVAGSMANQAAALRQQAATSMANGDSTTAAALTSRADALDAQSASVSNAATPSSMTAWLQNNAMLLAGVAIAIVTLPPLIRKL